MDRKLDRDEVIKNFSQRALEGKGLGPVLEMGQEHANVYRNYVTNRLIKKYLKLRKSDVVLDFGCGVGRVARYLSKYSSRVEALDASPEMIDYAEKNFENPSNVNYHVLSTKALPFGDKSVDKIFTFWVLQHLSDDEVIQVLREFKRVLNIDGKIVLFEQTLPVSMLYKDWSIHRTTEEYKRLISQSDLKLLYFKTALRNPSRGMSIWLRLKGKAKWLFPILYQIDNLTLNRKPEFVFYFTSALELRK